MGLESDQASRSEKIGIAAELGLANLRGAYADIHRENEQLRERIRHADVDRGDLMTTLDGRLKQILQLKDEVRRLNTDNHTMTIRCAHYKERGDERRAERRRLEASGSPYFEQRGRQLAEALKMSRGQWVGSVNQSICESALSAWEGSPSTEQSAASHYGQSPAHSVEGGADIAEERMTASEILARWQAARDAGRPWDSVALDKVAEDNRGLRDEIERLKKELTVALECSPTVVTSPLTSDELRKLTAHWYDRACTGDIAAARMLLLNLA